MRRFATIALVLVSAAARLSAQDAVMQLKLEQNKLSAAGASPSVSSGQTLRIEIPGVTNTGGAAWTMRMAGGVVMPAVIGANGVTFSGTVPNSATGNLTVTFDDPNGTVTLNNSPLVFRVAGGDGAAAAPATSTVATEAAFRRTYDQANDTVNLYFDANGLLVQGDIPRDVDDNDVFRLYLYTTATNAGSVVIDVEGTLSTADAFNVLGSASLPAIGKLNSTGAQEPLQIFSLGTFGPFAPPSITIKVSRQAGATKTLLRQYPVRINQTYLAAYRLLGAKSDFRYNAYTAAPVAGKTGNFIQNTASDGGEVRYFLTIVPYGWGFRGSSWRGRDIAKVPLWYERFNPMLGIGIKRPGKEYALGLSVEVARGFDLVAARHWSKVTTLAGGFSEGDAFSGASNTIPTVDKTQSETVFGLSLDLRVATQMLSSLFK